MKNSPIVKFDEYINRLDESVESIKKEPGGYITKEDEHACYKKLSDITHSIISEHSFYGRLISYVGVYIRAKYAEDLRGTAYTDGYDVYFFPEFLIDQTEESLRFVLIHEFLHIMRKHRTRKKHRNHQLWNAACDFVINDFIKTDPKFDKGWLEFPKMKGKTIGLWDIKFRGYKEEDVYEMLLEDPDVMGGQEAMIDIDPESMENATQQSGDSSDDGDEAQSQQGSGSGQGQEGDEEGEGSRQGSGKAMGDGSVVSSSSGRYTKNRDGDEVITVQKNPDDKGYGGLDVNDDINIEDDTKQPPPPPPPPPGSRTIQVGDYVLNNDDGNIYCVTKVDESDWSIEVRPITNDELTNIKKNKTELVQ